ncbi:hypothetical protein HN873_043620, partial [Arachis hypogaea]
PRKSFLISVALKLSPSLVSGLTIKVSVALRVIGRHHLAPSRARTPSLRFITIVSLSHPGLGKDGSGMVEPVQAQAMENRAGLGSQQKKLDSSLEVQAGDSYKMLIHKKAFARFREMNDS